MKITYFQLTFVNISFKYISEPEFIFYYLRVWILVALPCLYGGNNANCSTEESTCLLEVNVGKQ